MKINPTKYVFDAGLGKFLRYLITQQGIEVNPEEIQAIMDMQPPETVKDVR